MIHLEAKAPQCWSEILSCFVIGATVTSQAKPGMATHIQKFTPPLIDQKRGATAPFLPFFGMKNARISLLASRWLFWSFQIYLKFFGHGLCMWTQYSNNWKDLKLKFKMCLEWDSNPQSPVTQPNCSKDVSGLVHRHYSSKKIFRNTVCTWKFGTLTHWRRW